MNIEDLSEIHGFNNKLRKSSSKLNKSEDLLGFQQQIQQII